MVFLKAALQPEPLEPQQNDRKWTKLHLIKKSLILKDLKKHYWFRIYFNISVGWVDVAYRWSCYWEGLLSMGLPCLVLTLAIFTEISVFSPKFLIVNNIGDFCE